MNLTQYQKEAVEFMLARPATLLADEQGLGKTAEVINLIQRDETIRSVLVLCPAYLRTNWFRELDLWWTPTMSRDGHHMRVDEKRKLTITILSYDSTQVQPHIMPFDLVVCDEAHYLKELDTARYKRCEVVIRQAKKRIAVTGTPIPNRVRELFAVLSLLDPKTWNPEKLTKPGGGGVPRNHPFAALMAKGLVPTIPNHDKPKQYSNDFFKFAKRYCGAQLVEIRGKGKVIDGEYQPKMVWNFDGASNLDELKKRLYGTIMLRRLKQDVLKELPPKRRQLIVFPNMPPDLRETVGVQTLFSDLSEENYQDLVEKLESSKVLFEEWSKTRHKQAMCKLPYVTEHIEDCIANGSGKIIVFGHHTDVLEEIYQTFKNRGAVLVTGKTSKNQRTDAIDIFQDDPCCHFFVGSIGATGTGINLTAASHVIFSEIDPAPYRMLQAEDRAHRMGQKNMVLVQHLVWDGSIDARMAQIIVRKLEVQNQVLMNDTE